MGYSVKDNILPHVKALLVRDMETNAIASLGDLETLSTDSLIENNLTIAAVTIARIAPLDMFSSLTQNTYTEDEVTTIEASKYNKRGGWCVADDMCRIISVRANGWAKALHDVDSASNVLYDIARDPLNGTLGTVGSPYVCISYDNEERLEYYPKIDAVEEEVCLYVNGIPYPAIVNGEIDIEAKLYEAVCLYTAYLVAMEKKMSNAEAYKIEAMTNIGVNINN